MWGERERQKECLGEKDREKAWMRENTHTHTHTNTYTHTRSKRDRENVCERERQRVSEIGFTYREGRECVSVSANDRGIVSCVTEMREKKGRKENK